MVKVYDFMTFREFIGKGGNDGGIAMLLRLLTYAYSGNHSETRRETVVQIVVAIQAFYHPL